MTHTHTRQIHTTQMPDLNFQLANWDYRQFWALKCHNLHYLINQTEPKKNIKVLTVQSQGNQHSTERQTVKLAYMKAIMYRNELVQGCKNSNTHSAYLVHAHIQ